MRGKGRRSIKSNVVAARLQGEKFDNGIEVCFLSISKKKTFASALRTTCRLVDSSTIRWHWGIFLRYFPFTSTSSRKLQRFRFGGQEEVTHGQGIQQSHKDNEVMMIEAKLGEWIATKKKKVKFFSVAVFLCLNWLSKKKNQERKKREAIK